MTNFSGLMGSNLKKQIVSTKNRDKETGLVRLKKTQTIKEL